MPRKIDRDRRTLTAMNRKRKLAALGAVAAAVPVGSLAVAAPAHADSWIVCVPYTETTLLHSYAIVIAYLNRVGLAARDPFDCPLAGQLRGV